MVTLDKSAPAPHVTCLLAYISPDLFQRCKCVLTLILHPQLLHCRSIWLIYWRYSYFLFEVGPHLILPLKSSTSSSPCWVLDRVTVLSQCCYSIQGATLRGLYCTSPQSYLQLLCLATTLPGELDPFLSHCFTYVDIVARSSRTSHTFINFIHLLLSYQNIPPMNTNGDNSRNDIQSPGFQNNLSPDQEMAQSCLVIKGTGVQSQLWKQSSVSSKPFQM